MSLHLRTGDLFEVQAEAYAVYTDCQGSWYGKVGRKLKRHFKESYLSFLEMCQLFRMRVGQGLGFTVAEDDYVRYLFTLPLVHDATSLNKSYLPECIDALFQLAEQFELKTVALPFPEGLLPEDRIALIKQIEDALEDQEELHVFLVDTTE